MIKHIFIYLLIIHGLIHLIGFVKIFHKRWNKELVTFREPGMKFLGILWLSACLLFMLTTIFFVLDYRIWLLSCLVAASLSELLIMTFWKEAKWGTLANAIILTAVFISYEPAGIGKIVENQLPLFIRMIE